MASLPAYRLPGPLSGIVRNRLEEPQLLRSSTWGANLFRQRLILPPTGGVRDIHEFVQRLTQLLAALLVFIMFSAFSHAERRKDQQTWELSVLFKIGTDTWDSDPQLVKQWIQDQIDTAERIYSDAPKLVITPSFQRVKTLGGVDTSELHFRRSGKYRKWMDKYVDNKATSRTEGHLTVLVVDEICFGNSKRKTRRTGESERCIGGRAWFPHWVMPFSRKTGIVVRYQQTPYTLAHEIGHMLGLKHTFNRYVGLAKNSNCNYEYRKSHCGSCKGTVSEKQCSKSSNVMDYCPAPSKFLNDCQKRRAAAQRRMFMTRKGETKYKKLTGRK